MSRENDVVYWLPCSVVFISTAHENQRDIMTAVAMFVSEKEPLVLISVALNHLTEKLISQSGTFTLAIAAEGQKELAEQVASLRGEKVDKFEHFGIQTLAAGGGDAPVPEGAAAWMACKVEGTQNIKGYRLFIGRVVDQADLGTPPLVWRKDRFFSLKDL